MRFNKLSFIISSLLFISLLAACAPKAAEMPTVVLPAGMAYVDGKEIYFVHTEASDAGVAELLTDMMDSPVLYVPALANTPDEIMDLVAYGETRRALESLRALLSPARAAAAHFREHEMSAVLLMSRFENLERKAQAGVLYTQEDNVERAKITYDLAALINGVREAMLKAA